MYICVSKNHKIAVDILFHYLVYMCVRVCMYVRVSAGVRAVVIGNYEHCL